MIINLWLKSDKVTLYLGGDPDKGQPPIVTAELKAPQIIVEPDRYKVTIIETK